MKLTIDRNVWLRGEGASASCLLREVDGKRCCLGIYLQACGVRDEELGYSESPEKIQHLPNQAQWLIEPTTYTDTGDTCNLMERNDIREIGEDEREEKIASIFAKHNVEVEFIN